MKAPNSQDIEQAEDNWLQFNEDGKFNGNRGLGVLLQDCPEFSLTPFPFAVWEFMGTRINGLHCFILRANQSSLESALKYMAPQRVLVYNRQAELALEKQRVAWNGKTGLLIGAEYPHKTRALCLTDNGRTEYVPWNELKLS